MAKARKCQLFKISGRCSYHKATKTAPAFVREFCSTTDILICTAHELRQVADHLGLEDPRHLFELGLKAMIATRGRDGSQVITPDLSVEIPIVPAVQSAFMETPPALAHVDLAFQGRSRQD